jgi:Spy/CpxP family protein refolding chaperone
MKRIVMSMVLVLVAAGAFAQGDFDLPPGRWWENERLAARIGLTSEQREQIKKMVYQHAHRMIGLNADVKRAELELATTVQPADFEAGAARKAFVNFQNARRGLEIERFEMLLSVRDALTAEQWIQIQELRREFRRNRERGERMPGRRQPPERPRERDGGGPGF